MSDVKKKTQYEMMEKSHVKTEEPPVKLGAKYFCIWPSNLLGGFLI